jgi:short-subunit dehydrogenase
VSADVCVITGASSGIGRAIARAVATPGCTVIIVGRDHARLEETAASIREAGARPVSCVADLADARGVEAVAQCVRAAATGVDLLVHAAGDVAFGRLAEATSAQLDALVGINVRAPLVLTRELLPLVVARRGQIVFINSVAGVRARAGLGLYAATKHALKALADSLREEVSGDGVRVVSILPGRTATPMQERLCAREGQPYPPARHLSAEDVADVVTRLAASPPGVQLTDITIRPAAVKAVPTDRGGEQR